MKEFRDVPSSKVNVWLDKKSYIRHVSYHYDIPGTGFKLLCLQNLVILGHLEFVNTCGIDDYIHKRLM